jgi:hypothetical protein
LDKFAFIEWDLIQSLIRTMGLFGCSKVAEKEAEHTAVAVTNSIQLGACSNAFPVSWGAR